MDNIGAFFGHLRDLSYRRILISAMSWKNLLFCYSIFYLATYFARTRSQEESLLVIRGKNPERFFPKGSSVKDYWYGETKGLARAVQLNDVTVIFLYAPWCLFSIAARDEFERVARNYKKQVGFVAINCAWDAGECARKRRPEHFPLIGAYVGSPKRLFITYRGIPTAGHLKLFVESRLRPYSLISSESEFQRFIHTHEIAVVGVIPLAGYDSSGLLTFFNTSLLHLRHDPRGDVGFGAVSPKPAATFGLNQANAIYVFKSGSLVQIISDLNQQSDKYLEEVILRHMNDMTFKWTFPTLQKSFALSQKLQNTTLILFAPYELDKSCRPQHNIMRRIVSLYKDCQKKTNFTRLISADAKSGLFVPGRTPELKKRCKEIADKFGDLSLIEQRTRKTNCVCLPAAEASVSVNDFCWNKIKSPPSEIPLIHTESNCSRKMVCSDGLGIAYQFSTCCYPSSFRLVDDPRRTIMEMAACNQRKRECSSSGNFDEMFDVSGIDSIHGLGCRTNKTLHFTAIDSKMFPAFLEKIGVNLTGSGTRVVIFDKADTARYVMDGEFTIPNIVTFIHKYTFGLLRTNKRSSQSPVEKPGEHSGYSVNSDNDRKIVRLEEVTSNSFQKLVHEEEKDVVLLHYAPWCTFCKPAMSIFYNLAAQFLGVDGISFKRIDTAQNELLWEDRLDYVPAIQIFPTTRKRDNAATFPANQTLSLINLLKFTLLHSSHPVWQQFVTAKCGLQCWDSNRKLSKKLLRSLKKDLKRLRSTRALNSNCDRRSLDWRIKEARRKIQMLQQFVFANSSSEFFNNLLLNKEELHSPSGYFLRAQILSSRFS